MSALGARQRRPRPGLGGRGIGGGGGGGSGGSGWLPSLDLELYRGSAHSTADDGHLGRTCYSINDPSCRWPRRSSSLKQRSTSYQW